ncbi:MAG: hypothetical protein CL782_00850 [Chloroflexi bacterium]|nr:hypothetical protein [Chloroflexota bacterium]
MTMNEINNQIKSILGQFDSSPSYFQLKQNLINSITNHLSLFDFDLSDYPLIEPTELYVRKSGGEITNSLYSFIDPGGNRVSLRPEFTTSVIRSYLEDKDQYSLPVRRQYAGPVFRYQTFIDEPSFRQFTQQGCELIGSLHEAYPELFKDEIDTDALILRLSLESLAKSGIGSVSVKIGHVGFIKEILKKYNLTDAMELFVFSYLKDISNSEISLSKILEEAFNIGLISDISSQNPDLNSSEPEWTYDLVKSSFKELLSENLGRRTVDQVIDRFLNKRNTGSVNKDQFRSAINDLAMFINKDYIVVHDSAGPNILNIASEDTSRDTDSIVSGYMNSLMEKVGPIADLDVTYKVDFAIQRGLTYYTGLIFDIEANGTYSGKNLGGGGRYNGLVKSMGSDINLPAIGFAVNIESILECVKN